MERINQDVVWFLYADDMNLLRNTRLVYLMTLIIDKDYLYDIKRVSKMSNPGQMLHSWTSREKVRAGSVAQKTMFPNRVGFFLLQLNQENLS